MFGFTKKQQLFSLVFVHGKFIQCTYLNPKNYKEGSFVVVDVKGQRYTGRILENSTTKPEGTEGIQFKEIIKQLEPEDREIVIGWNDVIEDYFNSIGKKSKMRSDIQDKYDKLIFDLDEYTKNKNERDKQRVLAIVDYLKGNIKFKKDLLEKVEASSVDLFYSRRNEIKEFLTSEELNTINDKIALCDSRALVFHYILERIDAKTRTIKEPSEFQVAHRDKRIEHAILTLVSRN